MAHKYCKRCGCTKLAEEFSPDKRNDDGLQGQCKACRSVSRRTTSASCQYCMKEFSYDPSGSPGHYCSTRCSAIAQHAANGLNPESKGRNLVKIVRRNGALIPPKNCLLCSAEVSGYDMVAHHNDYSLPYDVTWMCRSCHCRIHQTDLVEARNGSRR